MRQICTSRFAAALAAVVALACGCASSPTRMSAADCADADWHEIGVSDGRSGLDSNALQRRRAACAEAGASVNAELYQKGYSAGLQQFCQPKSGYEYGLLGKEYYFVCPGDSEDPFVDAYKVGLHERELKGALRDAERGIEKVERNMQQAQTKLKRYESQIYSGNTSERDRQRLQAEVQSLARDIQRLQDERAQYRYAEGAARLQLEQFQARRPPIPGVN